MLRMITGLPGHGKTSYMLSEFLQVKDRPRFATHIEGLDYEKHDIGKLEHLKDIFDLPPGSLVLCDEAQKFLRPRAKGEKVADWVTEFETHRHKGIDLWYITQHPMLIDTHVRRLTEEHWHFFKPFGMRALTSVKKWERVRDDPNDYHQQKDAITVVTRPPKWIYAEYKSTVLDTTQSRFPLKMVVYFFGLLLLLAICAYGLYSVLHKRAPDSVEPAGQAPAVSVPHVAQPSLSSVLSGQKKRLTLDDFRPVHPMLPWTAPAYVEAAHIKAVPRFAGCMASRRGCECVTQQGTYLEVEQDLCLNVVYEKAMPFDALRADSEALRPDPAPRLAVAPASDSPPSNREFEAPYP